MSSAFRTAIDSMASGRRPIFSHLETKNCGLFRLSATWICSKPSSFLRAARSSASRLNMNVGDVPYIYPVARYKISNIRIWNNHALSRSFRIRIENRCETETGWGGQMPAVWKPGVKTSRESVCLPQASAHRGCTISNEYVLVYFQVCSFIVCQWSRFFLLFCKFCLKDFFQMLFSVFTLYREIYPGHRAEFFSAIPGSGSDGVVRFENQVAILEEWIFFWFGVDGLFLCWWNDPFCLPVWEMGG